jgi:hypothetical protein
MSAASVVDEALLKSIIGKPTGRSRVVIERGPVSFFAEAVLSDAPAYRDPAAAEAVGLAGIPAPPTYPFAMEHWGKFAEVQPEGPAVASPLTPVLSPLVESGGLFLHGEQEFTYDRPIVVGDVLTGEGRVVDAYQKESRGRVMTFLVTETQWVDERSGEPVVTSRFNLLHTQ